MMQSESYETSQAATGLFATVAAARPQQLMDGIGEAMLSKERSLKFSLSQVSNRVIAGRRRHSVARKTRFGRCPPTRAARPGAVHGQPTDLTSIRLRGSFWRTTETTILSSPIGLPECTAAEPSLGRLQTIWNNEPRRRSRFSIFRLRPCDGGRGPKSCIADENVESFRLTEEELF